MFRNKPIIGLAGGIGSGKSFVARLFADEGCLVISSDDQIRDAYREPAVVNTLRQWWGDSVFHPDGTVNRAFIASRIFSDDSERQRLEKLLHPMVAQARDRMMQAAADDPRIVAYVWDTPLLYETGLNRQCDAMVFIDSPPELRQQRLAQARGWDAAELARRENIQWPLDRKREISDYVISNTSDAGIARDQVRKVLSTILSRTNSAQAPD